eukprot:COSAG01_NODE_14198_length_1484_cov_1.630325_3_plen_53_part_00
MRALEIDWIQVGGLVIPYLIMANTSSWTVVLGEFLQLYYQSGTVVYSETVSS